ncbi:MAG: hypothetical protein JSU86_12760 [Phycisphaerales bacterium]|nr:MAG: hypothetical protein JSU86_12760 [Phycisphaerales bacterium]
MDLSQDLVIRLRGVRDSLEQEQNRLNIVGRALTDEEQAWLERLECALAHVRDAVQCMESDRSVALSDDLEVADTLRNGLYEGGNHELFVELRVDEEGSGVISADIYRNGATGRSYVASIRTPPGVAISKEDRQWQIVGTDDEQRTATGTLSLTPQEASGAALTGTLFMDNALTGLPVRTNIPIAANHVSTRVRRLGIEIERENNIDELPTHDFGGTEVTVRSVFESAGFDVSNVGQPSLVPTPQLPWGAAQLHALMVDLAQAQLNRPAWELHLLLLNKSSRSGLFGIMYDWSDPLPRQGAAVFAGEIKSWVSDSHFPRKLIQTTAHELGHGLNLAHRFEREVGLADSTSIMNYDWRYRGGNHESEYWSRFQFTFDEDELEFLRHAPRPLLIPGGVPFHSVNYWSDGNGGYSPYVPEVPIDFFQLTLRPPTHGSTFDFAQPVFLEIELRNLSDTSFNFSPEILDAKSDFVEILIRRLSDDTTDRFNPVTRRCYNGSASRTMDLPPGETINNNLNLTFGSAGFPFAEPGAYEVTALLVFYDEQNERDLMVRSNTLRIQVRYPHSREEEDDAAVLFRNDVGLYFALGGSQVLSGAREALELVQQRRQETSTVVDDPIVANIVRCAGIDAARPYERYGKRKFRHVGGDRKKAADLLEQLTGDVLERTFDSHTVKHTQRLAKKHRKAVGK